MVIDLLWDKNANKVFIIDVIIVEIVWVIAREIGFNVGNVIMTYVQDAIMQ